LAKKSKVRHNGFGDLLKWIFKFVFTTEHFTNLAALIFMGTYCFLQIKITFEDGDNELDRSFTTLVSMIAGFYFKGKVDKAINSVRMKNGK